MLRPAPTIESHGALIIRDLNPPTRRADRYGAAGNDSRLLILSQVRDSDTLASGSPLNDVTARGKAETRDRLCPVPLREGRMGGSWLSPMQEFGTRNQTLQPGVIATHVPIPQKPRWTSIVRYNFLEALVLRLSAVKSGLPGIPPPRACVRNCNIPVRYFADAGRSYCISLPRRQPREVNLGKMLIFGNNLLSGANFRKH
jgi:hypothetical protein